MWLTKLERSILDHRLDVPDAVADCLTPYWGAEQIYAMCDLLLTDPAAVAADIDLRNAVEGSTYYGAAKCALTTPQLRAVGRLASKVSALIGRTVRYPQS